ncbi:iron dependent repressor, metal binding and dimerization domain protein [Lacrimispora amygdalina]|jgi:Mn-dependent DtxR family transcriptional regulator|uniref:metal-dependent transcriptional regulator n=1 Tax=Lacrimispora TaxID=2719231 RepID=UPI001FA8C08E|nr:iron dependent repressor, metal binding and dimerization domain protein [Lacrimispora amygdalina]MDK2966238.1 DtxR family transcriptional regulator, Mn-dependent transcriptional regulator [Lacrimispora sp.]
MNKPMENEFHTVRGYQLIKQNESRLTPALEDYLEMTYRLCLEEDYTRINKLSEKLNVRPPSASKMVSKLVELDFLKYNNLDNILLTTEGRITGAYLLERHNIIESFFTLVGSANALEETELVEHTLASDTVLRIKSLLEFFTQNPSVNQKFKTFMDLSAYHEI